MHSYASHWAVEGNGAPGDGFVVSKNSAQRKLAAAALVGCPFVCCRFVCQFLLHMTYISTIIKTDSLGSVYLV